MLRTVTLGEYMLPNPITVSPDMTVHEAAHVILDNQLSGVTVMDDNQQVVGMLSELDCLRVILSSSYNDNSFGTAKVADVMTRKVITQNPNDDVVDVATSMLKQKHRRRPVVQDGKLVGQVTCRQILKVVSATGLKVRKD